MSATYSVAFTVHGRPQAKGSKRALPLGAIAGGRPILVDSNKRARPWANLVADKAAQAMDDYPGGAVLIRGPVAVEMGFYFARPRGHYGTGRNADEVRGSAPREMTVMPDIDKLARCSLDALTGVVLKDDAQVVALTLRKRYSQPSDPERLEVRIHEID